tara:strand:+ start:301 stop:2499 length:2199 start_codon:yes stop_codon:yes gene_type:complete
MAKKKRKNKYEKRKVNGFSLPSKTKQWIYGILLVLAAILIGLSFFGRAGIAGEWFMDFSHLLIGEAIFLVPLIFILGALIFLNVKSNSREERRSWPIILAVVILILGMAGILSAFNSEAKQGGWIGYLVSWPFLKYFGFWATFFIFLAPIIIGGLIFWQFLKPTEEKKEEKDKIEVPVPEQEEKKSFIKKIFAPKFKVHQINPTMPQEPKTVKEPDLKLESKAVPGKIFPYKPPPINLLDPDKGVPTGGDTKTNASIIKNTLQNFGISVEMSEIHIGPTVTQYAFKPAEGVKLSKITGLSNDLALSLAAHPIRIEAPIPGRSLVGVEIPNKVRAQVGLRSLIENPSFQKSDANLLLPLGKDVSGFPVYTDLAKMPHLLVAGSTGTGKTIFLNSLILSLLYQPSTTFKSAGPEILRLILVDPKRVEFPVYSNLPHLLCPIIYSATQTVNALKWLTGEMERRFDVLANVKVRNIGGFNEKALKEGTDPMPYIVVVIDELADLMMAKGREIESGIVRLAQMARAVGIHLVVATQRPSVEVITGLIKANIASRVTCKVASQVDSRTVLDTAGAEKLLGKGDLLFISAQVPKPKRIQGPYISEKEVRRVVKHIMPKGDVTAEMDEELVQELDRNLEGSEGGTGGVTYDSKDNDPLYEDAKQIVLEAQKASASLLQRRLRLGYARAARLIDIMETKGLVGPAQGSKPREIFADIKDEDIEKVIEKDSEGGQDEEWDKI